MKGFQKHRGRFKGFLFIFAVTIILLLFLYTDKVVDSFGMDYFEITPPGSIDARVLALAEREILE